MRLNPLAAALVALLPLSLHALPDEAAKQISDLEAKLDQAIPSSDEAARAMLGLVDLYRQHGHVFGLVRTTNLFASQQTGHPEHRRVLRVGIDALKATSRHTELQVACRQFLERYPEGKDTGLVWRAFAESLAASAPDRRLPVAQAYTSAWEQLGSTDGRRDAALAIHFHTEHNKTESHAEAAKIARKLVADLGNTPAALEFARRGFSAARRANDLNLANQIGSDLVKRAAGKLRDQELAQVHRDLADALERLDQPTNAITHYRRSIDLHATPEAYHGLANACAKANKLSDLATAVDTLIKRYPDYRYRDNAVRTLAHAYAGAGGHNDAAKVVEAAATRGLLSRTLQREYLAWLDEAKQPVSRAERALSAAADKLTDAQAWKHRWVLAFDIARDRNEDTNKALSRARELLFDHPADDPELGGALAWLLDSSDRFDADVDRYIATARANPHFTNYRNHLAGWVKNAERDKEKRTRANAAKQKLNAFQKDAVVSLWRNAADRNENRARDARTKLLARSDLTKPQRRALISPQAYYFRHRVGDRDRPKSVPLYATLAALEPDNYNTARAYIEAAASYGTDDEKRAAANHVLKFATATYPDGQTFSRLAAVAAALEDSALARKAYAWINATEKKHGRAKDYLSDTGTHLENAGLKSEANAYWKSHISVDPNGYESQRCASKLLERIPAEDTAARTSFLRDLLKSPNDNHGAYAAWLADIQLKAGDLAGFEKTLRAARATQDNRPLRNWGLGDHPPADWVRDATDQANERSAADRDKVLSVVRDLRNGRSSASATLALLDLDPDRIPDGLDRLVACYDATRTSGRHYTTWDWLKPYAQRRMADGRFAEAAALYAGLVHNVGSVGGDTINDARKQIRVAHTRLGTLGLEVDPDSPVAPLMEIGLHLRLDDREAATATYRQNIGLFDNHLHEVPVEIIAFAAETHIAEATEEAFTRTEDILRNWLIKFSEDEKVPAADKAAVQLLLGKTYQAAQRYDVARSEFTTVVNRYPDTPESTEATFGIGTTFLDQKVYEEADAIFSELASSPLPKIRIRAEFLRGVLAVRRDDREAARAIFRSVLQSMPDIELADRTLFELAEVYGLEKRFLDQLQLLRTVGRLGRESKRWHVPGRALSIVVQDTDLGISRGNSRIPVTVKADPGGDAEQTFLTSGGAGKGLFLGEIDTALGAPQPGDGVLQVLGADVVTVEYPEEFLADFRDVQPGGSEIRIASDATFAMASAYIDDPVEEDGDAQSAQTDEERRIQELLQTDRRPPNQIKPGNLIYFRTADPDRSLTADIDELPVKLVASSGDAVQVTLTETGADTGVFRGQARTADLPAGATASDTAIGHSPLMAIDSDPDTTWRSEPDGVTPKFLEVDMKDLYPVESVAFSSPSAETHTPVRFSVLGSHDGRFFYRLASFPATDAPEKPAGGFTRMNRRVYKIDNANLNSWRNVLDLAKKEGVQAQQVDALTWPDIPTDERPDDLAAPHAVLWQGLFNQPRDGAVRFELAAHRVAVMVDGDLVLPPTEEEGTVDVFLTAGSHELTVFATVADAKTETATALRARENKNSATVRLARFYPDDFPAPGEVEPAPALPAATISGENGQWTLATGARELRHLRMHIDEFLGEAVAVNAVTVTGGGAQPIPPDTDLLALANNDTLEIAPGDTITGTYIDQFTADGIGRNRPLSQTMTATYHNGEVLAVSNDFLRASNGSVLELRKEVLRIDPGERITIEVVDYDFDVTGQADTISVTATVQGKDRPSVSLTATETGPSTGVFHAELDTAAADTPTPPENTLLLAAGDTVFLAYEDTENTFPGHRTAREAPVFVRVPTDGDLRVVASQLTYPQPDPEAPEGTPLPDPSPVYLEPAPATTADAPKAVAYELPLTVTIVDPDAARDTRSTVAVDLAIGDRPPVRVLCAISSAFAPEDEEPSELRNPALHEGRFVGQLTLQLGSENSPPQVPAPAGQRPSLIGTAVPPEEDPDAPDTPLSSDPLVTVLNLTGMDVVRATYNDAERSAGGDQNLTDHARLASDAQLAVTLPTGDEPAELLHVGERLYLSLTDPDLDLSDARDVTTVTVTTGTGEKEQLPLEETLAHSGVFTASFPLKALSSPTPDNYDPVAPAVEAFFGTDLTATYTDQHPPGGTAPKPHTRTVPIAVGTDGLANAFSKIFGDEALAIQTQFHIAESYFELFKSHRELERDDQANTDLESGRRTLRELQDDYPDPKYAPRVAYLLGQFSQELGDWEDAIAQYESVVRDYPDHTLAADAQYKLGQCYEESQRFDEALDAYVGLAATYPESPLIASVMIRITDRFYKEEEYLASAGVGEKFLERFDAHQWAPRIAFRVGQCYYKAEEFDKAGDAFDAFIKKYPDDELSPQSLFWAGESYRMANNVPDAFRRYNRCRWDFPESDAAKYARGRLALPEMLAQFEREAQLDDN